MPAASKKVKQQLRAVEDEVDLPDTVEDELITETEVEVDGDEQTPAPEPMKMVQIPFKGQVFEVPYSRDDWSTEGLAYLSEDRFNLFTKCLLDTAKPGQWSLVCMVCPRRKDFAEFFLMFSAVINDKCID